MSVDSAPVTSWEQPGFEGFEVNDSEVTLSAVNVVLEKNLNWGDEVTFHIRAKIAEVRYALDKDKGGYMDSGRRKHIAVPIDVHLER
jgi:hypothetical protein